MGLSRPVIGLLYLYLYGAYKQRGLYFRLSNLQSIMHDRQDLSSVGLADVPDRIQLIGADTDGEFYREKLFGLVQMEMSDEKSWE
jgi:hypothetical protein